MCFHILNASGAGLIPFLIIPLAVLACPVVFLADPGGTKIKILKNIATYGLPTLAFIWHLTGSVLVYSYSGDSSQCNVHLYNLCYASVTIVNVTLCVVVCLALLDYLKISYDKVFRSVSTGYEAANRQEGGGERVQPWQPSPTRVVTSGVSLAKRAVDKQKGTPSSDANQALDRGYATGGSGNVFHEDPEAGGAAASSAEPDSSVGAEGNEPPSQLNAKAKKQDSQT